jgi:hypothetical protein
MNGVLSIDSGAAGLGMIIIVSPKTMLPLDIAGWYVLKETCEAERM